MVLTFNYILVLIDKTRAMNIIWTATEKGLSNKSDP